MGPVPQLRGAGPAGNHRGRNGIGVKPALIQSPTGAQHAEPLLDRQALPALLDSLEGDERNVLLTLTRMWRTLATGDFVPKDAAAGWAVARLPAEHAAVLATARDAYLGIRRDDWSARRQEARR